jgi:uncharacterized protein (TIGR03032 family)
VGVLPSGRPVFVNTLFSCLATVDEQVSFRPVWQPRFVTALRPEDRCHLNGLAMQEGRPRFVTAAGMTDAPVRGASSAPAAAASSILPAARSSPPI